MSALSTGLTSAVNNNKDRKLSSLLAIIMNNFFLASLAVLSGHAEVRLGQSFFKLRAKFRGFIGKVAQRA